MFPIEISSTLQNLDDRANREAETNRQIEGTLSR